MDERLRVAIIGCGYWGVNYVRVFSELTDAQLVAVCDNRSEALERVERRYPAVDLVQDFREVIARDDVDAVVVCTPASSHYAIAHAALLAGKHVLAEKPLTNRLPEANELTALALSEGIILMVGHTFLYHPAVRKVKEYIDRGDVGKLYYLYARRTNMGPIRGDVNALWDLAPHDVSIFNFWLGSAPEWVSAVGGRVLGDSHEDVGFISLGYPNHILAHIHVSWADAYKVREVVVVGSERRIAFNEFNPLERVRVFEKGVSLIESEMPSYGEQHLKMRDGDIISPHIDASEPLKNECSQFIECVLTKTRPVSDGFVACQVVRVMEAVDRSVAQSGAPVQLEEAHQYVEH